MKFTGTAIIQWHLGSIHQSVLLHSGFKDLGAQGYVADGAINFFKGNYYVKIKTYSKKGKVLQAAELLANRIAGMLTGELQCLQCFHNFPQKAGN